MKKYRYRKITPKILKKIRILKNEGLTHVAIAKKLEISYSCVQYWVSEEQREKAIVRANKSNKNMTKEKRKEKNAKKSEYRKEYIKARYNNDQEFRNRFKKMVMKNFRKRREVWVKDGLCSSCGGERIDKTKKTCERCRIKKYD